MDPFSICIVCVFIFCLIFTFASARTAFIFAGSILACVAVFILFFWGWFYFANYCNEHASKKNAHEIIEEASLLIKENQGEFLRRFYNHVDFAPDLARAAHEEHDQTVRQKAHDILDWVHARLSDPFLTYETYMQDKYSTSTPAPRPAGAAGSTL